MTQAENGRDTLTLPPLILHPFAKAEDTQKLVEGSRLYMALLESPREDQGAFRKLAECRYHEIRMLYFVGKDIFRWMEQCVEFVSGEAGLAGRPIRRQSFADFLVNFPPEAVQAKLKSWGVAASQVLLARAIGLRAVFAEPPEPDTFSLDFLRCYHRYADAMFTSYCESVAFSPMAFPEFDFQVYASGEYAKLLEDKWR